MTCKAAAIENRIAARKKDIVASRRRDARLFPSQEAKAAVEGKRPLGFREQTPVHVRCEPKDKDGGGASAASDQFCDNLGSKVGEAKNLSFRVVRLKQVEACERNCREISTGWVLERSKTSETPGEERL